MNQRLQRLGDQIQRELAVLIRDGIKDPRLTGMVTISSVKVSPDLGYAEVYVTVLEKEMNDDMNKHSHAASLKVLNKASGFLRTELSHSLKTRTTPRLRFHYDEVTAHGNHMRDLISKAMVISDASEAHNADDSTNETATEALVEGQKNGE